MRSPSGGAVPTEFKGDFRHLFSYKPQSINQIERVPILTKYHIQGGKPLSGTITISGAKNAAVLAAQMLAIHDARIAALLAEDREKMARSIAEKDAAIRAEAAAL